CRTFSTCCPTDDSKAIASCSASADCLDADVRRRSCSRSSAVRLVQVKRYQELKSLPRDWRGGFADSHYFFISTSNPEHGRYRMANCDGMVRCTDVLVDRNPRNQINPQSQINNRQSIPQS